MSNEAIHTHRELIVCERQRTKKQRNDIETNPTSGVVPALNFAFGIYLNAMTADQRRQVPKRIAATEQFYNFFFS